MLSKLIDYPGPLWRLYSAVAAVFVVLSLLGLGVIMCLSALLGFPRRHIHKFVRTWNASILFFYRVRVRVKGFENFDPKQPALLVVNHQSLFDIPVSMTVFPVIIRMVAKKELFDIPVFGFLLGVGGMIPVDRGNRRSGKEVADVMAQTFKDGEFVWVAPEGTRSKDGNLLPFKKGSFAMAIQLQLPVQPMIVYNSAATVPKGELLVRPGTVIDCEVLPRIPTAGFRMEERNHFSEKVRNVMLEKLEAYKTPEVSARSNLG